MVFPPLNCRGPDEVVLLLLAGSHFYQATVKIMDSFGHLDKMI